MTSIKRALAAALALLPWIAHAEGADRGDRPLPVFAKSLAENIVIEIDPRIELLAGVQSRTSWIRQRGPVARNAYYEELGALFMTASAEPAIRECEALIRRGFTYDAPPAMVLALDGGEAFRAPPEGWSDYLKKRAGGEKSLDRFRAALASAYDAVGFRDFIEARGDEYREWIEDASKGFDARAVSEWLDEFYGSADRPMYHFVLAPAMFPGGGYGFWQELAEGSGKRRHIYQIVRAQGSGDGSPGFPSGNSLASLALHEFSHSFVNPAIEAFRLDSRLKRIFKPVESVMRKMAYGDAPSFYKELIIRAATIIGETELGIATARGAEARILNEELLGFYPIRRVVELLGEYRSGGTMYADFAAFAPVLLSRLSEEADEIAAAGAETLYGGTRLDALPPAASFAKDFEDDAGRAIPRGFASSVGSFLQGAAGGPSALTFDAGSGSTGLALKLEADSGTSAFLFLHKPILAKRGKLTVEYRARGEGIRKEGAQYGNSYVGFIIVDAEGRKSFAINLHSGSFGWNGFSASVDVDPRKVRSIDFAIFLNESGALWVDDIEVAYR